VGTSVGRPARVVLTLPEYSAKLLECKVKWLVKWGHMSVSGGDWSRGSA